MSDNTNIDKQKVIDEYNSKLEYYNNLRDHITNLQKSISDKKADIKNTINTQNRVKSANYDIWSQLEDKSIKSKNSDEKEPSIDDILEAFK